MIVFVNDRFVPDELASVSVFDRGFLYGDGLFETIPVHAGRPFLWDWHLERLLHGARQLAIVPPSPPDSLLAVARELLDRNQLSDAALRIALSRGRGPRGYSPRGAQSPTLVLATFPAAPLSDTPPPPLRLITASHRLPSGSTLAGLKSANKLLQVLARAEADAAGADDALLLSTQGQLAEATGANLFWFDPRGLHTPPLADGPLAGTTRRFILERLAGQLGLAVHESSGPPETLRQVSGAFLASSLQGIVEIASIDAHPIARDSRARSLRAAYLASART